MRKHIYNIALLSIFLISLVSFGGETFTNDDARFRITFPSEFEEEKILEDGSTKISLSCVYGGMMLIGTIFIREEEISEEENFEAETLTLLTVAKALGSKVKKNLKTISIWNVGEESGLINSIKTKIEGKKYIGNQYTLIVRDVEYRFIILAQKKTYDTSVEARFINSFALLN